MTSQDILFVGDLHGCLQPLETLLQQANFQPDRHRLICVGDTLNRGPDSLGVLRLLRSLGASAVRGNHEESLLEATQAPEYPDWFDPEDFCPDVMAAADRDEWLEWIASWPLFIEEQDWLVVHAGLHPHLAPEQTPAKFLTRVRICDALGRLPREWDGHLRNAPEGFAPWHHFYQGEKLVVYGHWARQGFHRTPKTLCLDGGCVHGRELIGWWHQKDELVRVPSPYKRKKRHRP
ncbi:MAG: metallophosphoesterase [Myxococcales bacterium]|nr:metallophosphoesterase [Myxococcales bacterium]